LSTRVQRMILDTPPYVAIGTLTLLLIYFCPPRPGLRRLTRRPGFVACFAASLVILVSFSMDVLELLTHGNIASLYAHIGPHPVVQLEHSIEKAQQYPGYAVGAAWGLLWFGGRWRSEPSRLDALGRALGYYWLGFIVLGRFLSYFY